MASLPKLFAGSSLYKACARLVGTEIFKKREENAVFAKLNP
ncbi:hypothetical protein DES40_2142 [Litorimonas taeanensis]|uniref:Uncharacterized protein n=1 Tax=Litorimonas taeanensis TaxID=568099 RepID=A0A420WEK7_9PROT|nr:hypothetical protein [Litorimonas taeanensis]RKQ69342.1 hypothetical protein DES40_2142 [Litorimonas taeanensis]